jgi:putative transposase
VTCCTMKREYLFGEIKNEASVLSEYGKVVHECWLEIPKHFTHVEASCFVVMPDHFHGIVTLKPYTKVSNTAPHQIQPGSLAAVVRSFKSASTKRINELRKTPAAPVWQRNYYERIIRDEHELSCVARYIEENPKQWKQKNQETQQNLDSWMNDGAFIRDILKLAAKIT